MLQARGSQAVTTVLPSGLVKAGAIRRLGGPNMGSSLVTSPAHDLKILSCFHQYTKVNRLSSQYYNMYCVAYISFGVTLCKRYLSEQEFTSAFYRLIAIDLSPYISNKPMFCLLSALRLTDSFC